MAKSEDGIIARKTDTGPEMDEPRQAPVSPPASDELVCGRCGYPTRGLPSRTCPECGANRDEVEPIADDVVATRAVWKGFWLGLAVLAASEVCLWVLGYTIVPATIVEKLMLHLDTPPTGAYREARLFFSATRLSYPLSGLPADTQYDFVDIRIGTRNHGERTLRIQLPATRAEITERLEKWAERIDAKEPLVEERGITWMADTISILSVARIPTGARRYRNGLVSVAPYTVASAAAFQNLPVRLPPVPFKGAVALVDYSVRSLEFWKYYRLPWLVVLIFVEWRVYRSYARSRALAAA